MDGPSSGGEFSGGAKSTHFNSGYNTIGRFLRWSVFWGSKKYTLQQWLQQSGSTVAITVWFSSGYNSLVVGRSSGGVFSWGAKAHTSTVAITVWFSSGYNSLVQQWLQQSGSAVATTVWFNSRYNSLVQQWLQQPGSSVATTVLFNSRYNSLVQQSLQQSGSTVTSTVWFNSHFNSLVVGRSSGGALSGGAKSTHFNSGYNSLIQQWLQQSGSSGGTFSEEAKSTHFNSGYNTTVWFLWWSVL